MTTTSFSGAAIKKTLQSWGKSVRQAFRPSLVVAPVSGALQAVVTHPATLVVAGLLAAYTALLLLLQGRALSLLGLCAVGLAAACFTGNMTVVFLVALGVFYTYLLLRPAQYFVVTPAATTTATTTTPKEGLANNAPADADADAEPPAAATTIAEQKLDLVQTRIDKIQDELDNTLRPAVEAAAAAAAAAK